MVPLVKGLLSLLLKKCKMRTVPTLIPLMKVIGPRRTIIVKVVKRNRRAMLAVLICYCMIAPFMV